MTKNRFFHWDRKTTSFCPKCWYQASFAKKRYYTMLIMTKIRLFIANTKKRHFAWNVDYSRVMTKKWIFFIVITKKGLLSKMLISNKFWPKNNCFIVVTRKRPFARYVYIKRVFVKRRFFHRDHKKRVFCPKYLQFLRYDQKPILSLRSQNKGLLPEMLISSEFCQKTILY